MSSSTMTSGPVTADHSVSNRSTNSGGKPRMSVSDASVRAKAPGTARCRARTNVSQKRSGRSSLTSSVTHSRATGPRLPNHCATATVFPVAGPPVTSPTRQSGWARTSPKRGRATARTGTAGQPNFERGTESEPPPERAPARASVIRRNPTTSGSEVPESKVYWTSCPNSGSGPATRAWAFPGCAGRGPTPCSGPASSGSGSRVPGYPRASPRWKRPAGGDRSPA